MDDSVKKWEMGLKAEGRKTKEGNGRREKRVSGRGGVQRNGKGQVISNYFFIFQKSTLLSQVTGRLSGRHFQPFPVFLKLNWKFLQLSIKLFK